MIMLLPNEHVVNEVVKGHGAGLSVWLEHPWSFWDVSALDASSLCGD